MAADIPSPCNAKEFATTGRAAAPDCGASVIDLSHLARQTLGDGALEAELLALFDNQAARIIAQLIEPEAGDAKTRSDLTHTLKGSALAIGAGEVARCAQAYEAACATGPSRPALDDLIAAVAQARAAIARLLDRSPPASPGGADD